MREVTNALHLPPPSDHVIYDLEAAVSAAEALSKKQHWLGAQSKPKLDYYREVVDNTDFGTLVRANLKRRPRSLTAKLLCGILPLEVETGRFKKGVKVDRDQRFCKVCNGGKAETEYHFLFSCDKLKEERSQAYLDCVSDFQYFILLQDSEKVKYLLDPSRVKGFRNMVEKLYDKRRSCLFNPNK